MVASVGHLERDLSGLDCLPYNEIEVSFIISSKNNSNFHKTTKIYSLVKFHMFYDSIHDYMVLCNNNYHEK